MIALSLPKITRFGKRIRIKFALPFQKMFFEAVSKFRSFLKYWLPIILWMSLIFSASSDMQSFHHSSRILRPILLWLFPHLPENVIETIVFTARKGAHLTEYAILGWLYWRVLRKPVKADPRPWSWRHAGIAILLVAIYASTDEFHQRFVPGREGCVRDVLIDTLGATFGMLFLWRLHYWCRRMKQKSDGEFEQKGTKASKVGI
jgi:VanZ family protein